MSEINRFEGYRAVQEQPRRELPVGGYVAQIQAVKLTNDRAGRLRLVFCVEIVEGPFEGFFHQDYESRKGGIYDAKYHGTYNIPIPDSNTSEENRRNVDRFNLTMGAIEGSNPGYTWNWKIESLKGLKVGISVRETEYRGSVYTEIGKFIPLSIIRSNHFKPMARRVSNDSISGIPIVTGNVYPAYNTASIPGTNQNIAARQVSQRPADSKPLGQTTQSENRYGPGAMADDTDIPF